MAEFNDYVPPEAPPDEDYIPSDIGPYDPSDERLYTTRLTPYAHPWGFSIGDEWGWGCGQEAEFGFSLGSLVSSVASGVSHFASNAVAVAGKAIDTAAVGVSTVAKGVGNTVAHIPVVGGPVSNVFSSAWNIATSPLSAAVAIAHGERVDRAIINRLEKDLQDVKTLAGYAAVVTSMVPGVGTGVSAAIGAGSALMNGQPITDALMAGVASAVPGGALATAAAKIGYEGVKAAKDHSKLDLESVSKTALGGIAEQLGMPPAAKQAMLAGVTMTGQLAHGVSPENAIPAAAIDGLPLPPATKQVMHQANDLAHALASGKRVDRAVLAQSDAILQHLPVAEGVKTQVRDAIKTGKGILATKNPSETLAVALKIGLADKLITSSGLPPQVRSALNTGLAMGTAGVKQAQRHYELATHASGKLIESGVQLSKAVPSIAEGRRLAGPGHKGFDIGHGILGMRASLFDISATRKLLEKSPHDLKGFDMAVAQKIGLVTTKPSPKLSHAARAGYAMTVGMQSYNAKNKAAMMKNIQAHPSASVGAKVAVHQIVQSRENWFEKLLRFLGLARK